MNAIPLVELYAQEASHNRNRQSFGDSIIATENGRGNDSGRARASLLGRDAGAFRFLQWRRADLSLSGMIVGSVEVRHTGDS
jgi:hypothetical protein